MRLNLLFKSHGLCSGSKESFMAVCLANKSIVTAYPFQGGRLFREALDKILIEARDKKKMMPRTLRCTEGRSFRNHSFHLQHTVARFRPHQDVLHLRGRMNHCIFTMKGLSPLEKRRTSCPFKSYYLFKLDTNHCSFHCSS